MSVTPATLVLYEGWLHLFKIQSDDKTTPKSAVRNAYVDSSD